MDPLIVRSLNMMFMGNGADDSESDIRFVLSIAPLVMYSYATLIPFKIARYMNMRKNAK